MRGGGEEKERKRGKNLHTALGSFFATRPLIGVKNNTKNPLHWPCERVRVMTRYKPLIGVYNTVSKMKMKQKNE